jgi:hypothetical protein
MPRVPSPTPPYFDLYYQANVLDYFVDPDSLVEHFTGTTLSVKPVLNLSSVLGAFSLSPLTPNLLSPLLPSSSAPAVSGGSQDGLTSDNSEDDALSVDAHLLVSSQTSPVPVPYTLAQQIATTNPTICPLITTLAPLMTLTWPNVRRHATCLCKPTNPLKRTMSYRQGLMHAHCRLCHKCSWCIPLAPCGTCLKPWYQR